MLVGSLTREAASLGATFSLVDVAHNRIVWGGHKNATSSDLQTFAAMVARDVATRLGAKFPHLYSTSEEHVGNPELTGSPAWSHALGAISRHDMQAALSATEGLAHDFPNEAEAWVLRSRALFYAMTPTPSKEACQRTLDAIGSLERIDPQHPRVVESRVRVRFLCEGPASRASGVAAIASLLQRDDFTPARRAEILLSRIELTHYEDSTAAMTDLRECLHLVPANAGIFVYLADMLIYQGKTQEALERAKQAVALDPSNPFSSEKLGFVLEKLGRYDEAVTSYRAACEIMRGQQQILGLARVLWLGGHRNEAKKLEQEASAFPEHYNGLYNIACYQALTGNREGALRSLRRALQLGWEGTWITRDPDLVTLYGDPEFEAIVAEVKKRLGQEGVKTK